VALPVRITYYDSSKRPCIGMACSYDISSKGAKISGIRYGLKSGEIVAVERNRNRVFCRVVWVGDENSPLKGQIGIECTDPAKGMWENELRELGAKYEHMSQRPAASSGSRGEKRDRRRDVRAKVEGWSELVANGDEDNPCLADLQDLSETGCRVISRRPLVRGTGVELVVNVAHYDLKFKGQVRHALDLALGIEFREVRKGDRQILEHLLRKLAEQHFEESYQLV
jgi:hypothetical protein